MADQKLREVFEKMPSHFVPGMVDRDLAYYFSLGEAADEKWTVFLDPSSAVSSRARPPRTPTVC
jgi:hypothetical protein